MAAQIGSSGWENNMKRVAAAMFSRLLFLPRNFNRKISINQNMATHSQCLLMSGLYNAGSTVLVKNGKSFCSMATFMHTDMLNGSSNPKR